MSGKKIRLKLKHSLLIVIVSLLLMTGLTACFDSNEIDDMIYIVSVGVDQGISDKWRLTLQFENMKENSKIGSGGSSSEAKQGSGKETQQEELTNKVVDQGNLSYVTIDAPSFYVGIDMLNTSISRKISFMHIQFIVFSQEIAESGKLGEFIAPLIRFREIRESANIYTTKGKALDVIKAYKPFIGMALAKDHLIWTKESENTGFFPSVNLYDFYNNIKSNYRFPITAIISVNDMKNFKEEGEPYSGEYKTGGEYLSGKLPRLGLNELEIWGTALFDGDKMVGELDGYETRLLLMLRGDFERAFMNFQDPKKPDLIIPLDATVREKPKIKVSFKDGKPVVNVDLKLDADILAIQSNIYYENTEMKKFLEETYSKVLVDDMAALMTKCRDLGVDAFKFGEYSTKKFLTIQDLEAYNWNNHFKEATVALNVSVIIRRTGTMLKSSKIISTEGQSE